MERDRAVGLDLVFVAGVVDAGVVPPAEADAVFDGGGAAVGPSGLVVGVESGAAVAALGPAALVTEQDREPLGLGVQALLPAQVEGDRVAAEDGGDDPGLARDLAGEPGGDPLAGVQQACLLD